MVKPKLKLSLVVADLFAIASRRCEWPAETGAKSFAITIAVEVEQTLDTDGKMISLFVSCRQNFRETKG